MPPGESGEWERERRVGARAIARRGGSARGDGPSRRTRPHLSQALPSLFSLSLSPLLDEMEY
eukprot:scaffold41844_cov35-Tisochrysis_lutea.AAC.1